MSADAAPSPLTKVDSAVQGLSSSPPKEGTKHRRVSSSAAGVMNINDLGTSAFPSLTTPPEPAPPDGVTSMKRTNTCCDIEKDGVELLIAKETQKLNWYEDIPAMDIIAPPFPNNTPHL